MQTLTGFISQVEHTYTHTQTHKKVFLELGFLAGWMYYMSASEDIKCIWGHILKGKDKNLGDFTKWDKNPPEK